MNHGRCINCIWYNNYSLCTPEEETKRRAVCPEGKGYCGMGLCYIRPDGWCQDYKGKRKKVLCLAIG